MNALTSMLVPIILIVAVALIIWYAAERFSPDPLITKIVQIVVFAMVLVVLLMKLLPLIV
jgi:Co/Zn/Cd efflux system component